MKLQFSNSFPVITRLVKTNLKMALKTGFETGLVSIVKKGCMALVEFIPLQAKKQGGNKLTDKTNAQNVLS